MTRITRDFTFFFHEDSVFSNWNKNYPFEEGLIEFSTNEHYMMFHKAILFNDLRSAKKILICKSPAEAKSLGRSVIGFKPNIWNAKCEEIVYNGTKLKFMSHPKALQELFATRPTLLVEASPGDLIWGIGLSAYDENATDSSRWRGRNKLGSILTELRENLFTEIKERKV